MLCYYAYSDLYQGSSAVRQAAAGPRCAPEVPEPAAGYNFALLKFTIDGNLLRSGPPDGTFEFVDTFSDGLPNSHLVCSPSPCIEEDGALQLAEFDDNGTLETVRFGRTLREDDVFLRIPFGIPGLFEPLVSGEGASEVRAFYRAVSPRDGEFYCLGIANGGFSLRESTALCVGSFEGQVGVAVNDAGGAITAADPVDLSAAQGIVLRLLVVDAFKLVVPFYSLDGGLTFKQAANWDFFDRFTPIFQRVTFAFPFLQGGRVVED